MLLKEILLHFEIITRQLMILSSTSCISLLPAIKHPPQFIVTPTNTEVFIYKYAY